MHIICVYIQYAYTYICMYIYIYIYIQHPGTIAVEYNAISIVTLGVI